MCVSRNTVHILLVRTVTYSYASVCYSYVTRLLPVWTQVKYLDAEVKEIVNWLFGFYREPC